MECVTDKAMQTFPTAVPGTETQIRGGISDTDTDQECDIRHKSQVWYQTQIRGGIWDTDQGCDIRHRPGVWYQTQITGIISSSACRAPFKGCEICFGSRTCLFLEEKEKGDFKSNLDRKVWGRNFWFCLVWGRSFGFALFEAGVLILPCLRQEFLVLPCHSWS